MAWRRTPAVESQGQISPDGRWLADRSDESGRLQVYLRPFAAAAPAPNTKWPASAVSGREPRWRGGRERTVLGGIRRGDNAIEAHGRADRPGAESGRHTQDAVRVRDIFIVPQGNCLLIRPFRRWSAVCDQRPVHRRSPVARCDPELGSDAERRVDSAARAVCLTRLAPCDRIAERPRCRSQALRGRGTVGDD